MVGKEDRRGEVCVFQVKKTIYFVVEITLAKDTPHFQFYFIILLAKNKDTLCKVHGVPL